jgi:photosystem I subunit 3
MAAMLASQMTSSLAGCKVEKASIKGSFKPARAVSRKQAAVCSAQKQEPAQMLGSALAATALAAALSFSTVDAAKADVAGLTPCSESKAFAKREKNEIKALQKRLKQYEADSAPALALNATIQRTEKRFATYGKQGLLCGTDGLPHLISDPGLAIRYGHTGETLIPTIGFLYVAGYIGSVGREYLNIVKKDSKPRDKEIIIDVPLALKLSAQGAGWPFRAIQQLRNGSLLEDDKNITVSPR